MGPQIAEPLPWNPVKELKARLPPVRRIGLPIPWNPVKELKVEELGVAAIFLDTARGIR